jgi:hypothetical protein
LNSKFGTLQAFVAKTLSPSKPTTPTPTPAKTKLLKPASHNEGKPEVVEFERYTWKWGGKCFGGAWNSTHVTAEQQPGRGRSKHCQQPPPNDSTPLNPQANIAAITPPVPQPEANIAQTSNYLLDFVKICGK